MSLGQLRTIALPAARFCNEAASSHTSLVIFFAKCEFQQNGQSSHGHSPSWPATLNDWIIVITWKPYKSPPSQSGLISQRCDNPHRDSAAENSNIKKPRKYSQITGAVFRCLGILQITQSIGCVVFYIDGLVQNCKNSSALAVELLQSCTEPSIQWCCVTV